MMPIFIDYSKIHSSTADHVTKTSLTGIRPTPCYQYCFRGDKGDSGLRGEKGEKGNTGEQGPMGLPGPYGADKGDKGEPGLPGKKGESGVQGPTGPRGYPGSEGQIGPRGYTRRKGEQGFLGIQGINDLKVENTLEDTLLLVSNTTDIIKTIVHLIIQELDKNAKALSDLQSILNYANAATHSTQTKTQDIDKMAMNVVYNFVYTHWHCIVVIGTAVVLMFIRRRYRKDVKQDEAKTTSILQVNEVNEVNEDHFYNELNFSSPLIDDNETSTSSFSKYNERYRIE